MIYPDTDLNASMHVFGEVREDQLEIPTNEVSIDLIDCIEPDWSLGSNISFMDRLTQIFAALHFETHMRTVIIGPDMQRRLPNGGILGSRNIIYAPDRSHLKATGLRLICVDAVEGLVKALRRLEVPHAWVVGNGDTYRRLAPYCRRAYIASSEKHHTSREFMPSLEHLIEWRFDGRLDKIWGTGRRCSFTKYINDRCQQMEKERIVPHMHEYGTVI